MPHKVEISHKTIIFTFIFLIILWLVVEIREIIFLVFVSFILMSAFKPVIEMFEKIKISRIFSVIIIYLMLLVSFAFIGSTVLPPLITQTIHLGDKLPEYISTVLPMVKIDAQMITQQVGPLGENILKVTIGLFSNIFAIFTIFVVSFYFLLERQYLQEHLSSFFGTAVADNVMMILEKVEEKLGAWVRGQLLLGLTIWFFTYIGLTMLGIPYVLSLSIFAGMMEIVPIIGPIISAIPAILVALTISPVMALGTVALFFAVQQVEAHLVVPMVMKRAVGLPPVVSIIALMVGAKLGGIMGALLSVPVILTLTAVLKEYLHLREKK